MGALCTKEDLADGIVVERATIAQAPKISEDDLHHWHIWSQLDLLDETKQVQLAAFMHTCLDMIGSADDATDLESVASSDAIAVDGIQLHDFIHLQFPLSIDQVASMSQAFAEAADGMHIPLPTDTLTRLMSACAQHYEVLPNVVHLTIPSDTTLTIVGDVHGQLHDVLHIFKEQGPPSPTNWYLFNGDFVDRGNCSVEICALLFAYHMLYPTAVHINRGNHEDPQLNRLYSFQREVMTKYDRNMYGAFNAFFERLPLAHVINDAVFVVHGGLPAADVTLTEMDAIPRREFQLHFPKTLSSELLQHLSTMRDMLWSDPSSTKGSSPSRRGAGVVFGPDVTARFLRQNGLKLLVRAHEPAREGFDWPYAKEQRTSGTVGSMVVPAEDDNGNEMSSSTLVTIFSGSNYCYSNNKGAYMVLQSSLAFELHTFQVPTTYRISPSMPGFRSIEDHNRHNLMQLIGNHKKALLAAFEAKDSRHLGVVSIDDWVAVLGDVLQLELDWSRLAPVLLPPRSVVKNQDKVEYAVFLESYQTTYAQHGDAGGQLDLDTFYMYRKELQVIFCFFDKDNSGYITLDEFQQGCALLNAHVADEDAQLHNIATLFQELDLQGTGKISINAFLEAFRITNARETRKSLSFSQSRDPQPVFLPVL
ncbi:hypothetical protein SDRG_09323 [Saprolegnia diclina VS20]|uniref:Serine/threonine-protein phosphatase n=1 Tax=Saprolegnia diclina (strain VS20) TaxID=1156394 RepID=T0RSX9_SAPDV|nr:hypothetical protein SDRG_09323 [Saprolegnia diclina VS20]EQC33347.1 hypothetical protein SDRG_09323 [Saprolegnia diclina VS20]|eukprot:XP_008613470.1 hypothetical protein SDRG_09323 [Saprolegnia diclina VS20]